MKKVIFILTLLGTLNLMLFSQEQSKKKKIAIIPFEGGGITVDEGNGLAQEFARKLNQAGDDKYSILPRTDAMESIAKEFNTQSREGYTARGDTLIEQAKALNADYLVTGTVFKADNGKKIIFIGLLDIKELVWLSGGYKYYSNLNDDIMDSNFFVDEAKKFINSFNRDVKNLPTLAVIFEAPRINIVHKEIMYYMFSYDLANEGKYAVVIRKSEDLEAMQKEINLQNKEGFSGKSPKPKTGDGLNAKYVAPVNVKNFGKDSLIYASIMNTETHQQYFGKYEIFSTDLPKQDMFEYFPTLAKLLSKDINTSGYKNKQGVAIYPFEGGNNTVINKAEKEILAQILSINIANSGAFKVIPRTSDEKSAVDEEVSSQNTENLTDQDTKSKSNSASNAELTLHSKLTVMDGQNRISTDIMDMETATLGAGESFKYNTTMEAYYLIPKLADELTGLAEKKALDRVNELAKEKAEAEELARELAKPKVRVVEYSREYNYAHAGAGWPFLGLGFVLLTTSLMNSSINPDIRNINASFRLPKPANDVFGNQVGFEYPKGAATLNMSFFYVGLGFTVIGAIVLATGWKTVERVGYNIFEPVEDLSILPYISPDVENGVNYGVNLTYRF